MDRYVGLKRKVPLLYEERSGSPTTVVPKLKKQPFRPPFAVLKEDQNSLPNDTTESKQNATTNVLCKFTENVGEANDGVWPVSTPKENLRTHLVTLNLRKQPLLSQRHGNILESDCDERPGQLDTNDSLLSASKLNLPAPNPQSANQNASTSAKEKSAKSVKTYESATRKPFISRDLINPVKNSYSIKTENNVDARQAQYYSVLYAKRKNNTKPKGPWSDGVLLVSGRKYTLQSIDGKPVTEVDCQGCRHISEGVTLEFGKFHLEVVRESSHDEYSTGALFMRNTSSNSHFVESIQRSNKRPSFQHSHIKAG
ncbi:hypothetical protein KI387_029932, partial [Taxus chinensis]